MANMRREIAIGFSAIAALLIVLGVLVYRRATATWGPAETEAAATMSDAKPIDSRPHVVVAEDTPFDGQTSNDGRDLGTELTGAEEPVASERGDRMHASFLPRQFESADPDPTVDDSTSGQADGSGVEDPSTAPAENDMSAADPFRGRATSLEVADGTTDTQLADDDTADPGRLGGQPEWTADDAATAGEQPTSGTFSNESTPVPFTGEDYKNSNFDQPEQQSSTWDRDAGRDRQPQHSHPPERVAVENGKYTVAPNDNYWIIAEKVYGNGGYFKALHEHNRQRHPRSDKLQVGDVLEAPPVTTLAERYPDLCPRPRRVPPARQTLQTASTRHRAGERVYVVGEGDTLFDIARHELGKASRWTEVYDLNHDVLGEDFDYLRPGTELVLPHDARESDTVTRKDDPRYQR